MNEGLTGIPHGDPGCWRRARVLGRRSGAKDPFEAQSRGPGIAGDATAGGRAIASTPAAGHRSTGGQIPTAARWGPSSAPRSDAAVATT